jgi:hypothetical protein
MPSKGLLFFGASIFLNGCLVAAASAAEPTNNNTNDNFIGPTVTFGSGQTIIGVGGKFKITDQISVRPSYSFANLAGAGVTVAGGSATYEIEMNNPQLQPFVGVGVNVYTVNTGNTSSSTTAAFAQAGVDVKMGQSVAITGDVKVPLDAAAPLGTVVSIGGGYRF